MSKTSEYCFTDTEGQVWDLKITFASAKRMDEADYGIVTKEKISVLDIEKEGVTEIISNPALLMSMIYVLVRPQLEVIGITDPNDDDAQMSFLDRFDGKTIAAAKRAFWGALADFHQDKKTGLLKLLKFADKAQAIAAEEMEGLEDEFEAVVSEEVKRIAGETRTEIRSRIGKISSPS